ncbi:hypothetical protein [Streptomyces antibioticus]|uniref:hypothetical protein n=1 Tax=Streptomyces antibioticus TaxID=1890 RepID=UPI00340CBE95
MLNADSVTNRYIPVEQAQEIAVAWNGVYPAMRRVLDTVINAQRGAERRTVNLPRLERVRRELGQLDRGTYRGCTRSPAAFSISGSLSNVRAVLEVTSVGTPELGDMYRLAALLADATVQCARRFTAEQEAARTA